MAKKPVRKQQTRATSRAFASPSKPVAQRRVAAIIETTTLVEDDTPTFKQRLAGLVTPGLIGGRNEAAQLAEVREGVMEELRKQGNPGQPFQGVLLPMPRRRRGVPAWMLGTVAALAVLVGLVWWVSRPPAGAELALHRIEDAVADKNTAEFERLVDTPTLSANIVNQVFTPAMQNADAMMADQFEASVKAHLQSFFQSGEAAPAQPDVGQSPGLAVNLHDQILAAVSAGRWPSEPGSLLGQLWEQLGGDHLRIGHPRVVTAMPTRVEAELPLSRDDIAFDVALRLVLEKKDHQWQLVDMPNLAQALGLVNDAEAAADDATTATAGVPGAGSVMTVETAPAPVTADVLQAAKDNHGHVLARVNVANMSGLPVRALDMALIIGDADGRPLKQVMVHETAPLAPTESAEKTYTIALNSNNPHEAIIGKLPLTALTVRVTVVGVVQ